VTGNDFDMVKCNHQWMMINHKLHVCFNYVQSTIDYCGLVTISSLNRLRKNICRTITDVCFEDLQENIRQYQIFINNNRQFQPLVEDERIERLKQSLQHIEKRLELLENAQLKKSVSHDTGTVKRKLTQKKNALLKQILFENKQLKGQ